MNAKHTQALQQAAADNAELATKLNTRWYPKFHIAAPAGWINDPNGLSFFKERFQVYFQHCPSSPLWGPMHWGHVSSSDLVTWKREPIALAPNLEADRDGVFSGSAVVSDEGVLHAYYTGHRWKNGVNEDEGNLQVQCLATSKDGVNFTKHGVVVEGPKELPHFRDPKVWRIGDTWYMIFGACSAENRGEVWMYTSTDMKHWEFDRVLFQDPNPDAYMLECPDLFPVGDHWVLIYCPMGPEPDHYQARNGHNAGYVVGDWAPGQDFQQLTEYRPIDWGHNFYAPQTFEAPDGRRIGFGWMGSFTIPLASQQDSWAGQLTAPREFTLDEELNLRNAPIAEVAQLRGTETDLGAFRIPLNGEKTIAVGADTLEILLEVDLTDSSSERIGIRAMETPDGAHTYLGYDDLSRRVFIDRRLSGNGDRGLRAAPYSGAEVLKLRILIDRGSIEIFVNDGEQSVSSFTFPNEGERSFTLCAESGDIAVKSLKTYELKEIWEEESA